MSSPLKSRSAWESRKRRHLADDGDSLSCDAFKGLWSRCCGPVDHARALNALSELKQKQTTSNSASAQGGSTPSPPASFTTRSLNPYTRPPSGWDTFIQACSSPRKPSPDMQIDARRSRGRSADLEFTCFYCAEATTGRDAACTCVL